MADNNPRRPHAGQQYTHGWNPVTPAAAVQKNHGKAVKKNSAISRLLKEASESHQRMRQQDADRKAGNNPDMTPSKGAPTKSAAAKAGQSRGPESQKAEDALRAALGRKTAAPKAEKSEEVPASKAPEKPAEAPKSTKADKTAKALDYAKKLPKPDSSKTSSVLDEAKAAMDRGDHTAAVNALTKAKTTANADEKKVISKMRSDLAAKVMGKDKAAPTASGKKVGEDSRGNPLKTGDDVKITAGPNAGKTGKVAGKGKSGAILVDTGEGDPVSMSPANLSASGTASKQEAPKAPVRAEAKADAPKLTAKPASQSGAESGDSSNAAKGPYGFDPSAPKAQQVEQAQRIIREAYDDLADEQMAGWLHMVSLRRELKGIPRDVQDDALMKLIGQPDMRLIHESVRRGMSQEEKDAALLVLGDPDNPIDMLMVTNPDGSRREAGPNHERLKANRERATQEGPEATDEKPKPAKTYDFDSSAPRPQQVDRAAEVIREAYDDLDDRKGRTGWLPLIELRKSLKGIPRDVQDDALKQLMADSNFNTNDRPIRDYDSGPTHKAEDLDKAALDVFGEPVHEIMIADPLSGRARRKAK